MCAVWQRSTGLVFALVVCGFLVVGCAEDTKPDPDAGVDADVYTGDVAIGDSVGSCTSQAGCTDYTGSLWTAASAEETCNQIPNGVFSTGACPAESRVGRCVNIPGGDGEYVMSYYSPTFEPATAQAACNAMPGSAWVPESSTF
jgi:hypothetical protein